MVAVRNLPLTVVAIVSNATPLIVALFGAIILSETLSFIHRVCLGTCFVGVALIVSGKMETEV